MALRCHRPRMSPRGLSVRHNHGSQYTSDTFQTEIRLLSVQSSPVFIRAPERNACAECFIRTLEEHLLSEGRRPSTGPRCSPSATSTTVSGSSRGSTTKPPHRSGSSFQPSRSPHRPAKTCLMNRGRYKVHPAQGRRTHHRQPLERHPRRTPSPQLTGVCKLLHRRRIRARPIGFCSSQSRSHSRHFLPSPGHEQPNFIRYSVGVVHSPGAQGDALRLKVAFPVRG